MNRYFVVWTSTAENELAELWLIRSHAKAITKAQAEMDRLLGSAPDQYGTELSEGLWQIAVPPLVVFYSIDKSAYRVEVTDVRILG